MHVRGIIHGFRPRPVRAMAGGEGGGAGGGAGGAGGGDGGAAAAAAAAAEAAKGAGGAGGQGGGQQQQQSQASWRDGLSDGLRDHAALKGFGSIDDLAKEHVNLQGLIGRKGVIPPAADAGEEAWGKFYNELGRPASPDKYDLGDFKPPEGLPWSAETQGVMMGVLHKAGLNNAQVRAVLDGYGQSMQAQYQGMQAELDRQLETTRTALKKEWGGDFDTKVALGTQAAAALFGDQLDTVRAMRMADGSMLLDNPLIVKAMVKAGESIGGETLGLGKGGGAADPLRSAAAAKAEIERIRKEQALSKPGEHVLDNKRHPEHQALTQRLQQLYKVANGEA